MNDFALKLQERLQKPLPASEAHALMRMQSTRNMRLNEQTNADTRLSAVMILLFPEQENIFLPLILRPPYEGIRSHGGQVALPGGKKEPEDKHLIETALRETWEEIGVKIPDNQVIGTLTEIYISPSNMLVKPVIAYLHQKPQYNSAPKEVAAIFETPMTDLWKMELRKTTFKEFGDAGKWEIPYFDLHNQIVWGATAAILSEFSMVASDIWNG